MGRHCFCSVHLEILDPSGTVFVMTPPMSTPAREGETIEGSRPALVLKKTIKSHQRPALSRASPCCILPESQPLCANHNNF